MDGSHRETPSSGGRSQPCSKLKRIKRQSGSTKSYARLKISGSSKCSWGVVHSNWWVCAARSRRRRRLQRLLRRRNRAPQGRRFDPRKTMFEPRPTPIFEPVWASNSCEAQKIILGKGHSFVMLRFLRHVAVFKTWARISEYGFQPAKAVVVLDGAVDATRTGTP